MYRIVLYDVSRPSRGASSSGSAVKAREGGCGQSSSGVVGVLARSSDPHSVGAIEVYPTFVVSPFLSTGAVGDDVGGRPQAVDWLGVGVQIGWQSADAPYSGPVVIAFSLSSFDSDDIPYCDAVFGGELLPHYSPGWFARQPLPANTPMYNKFVGRRCGRIGWTEWHTMRNIRVGSRQ